MEIGNSDNRCPRRQKQTPHRRSHCPTTRNPSPHKELSSSTAYSTLHTQNNSLWLVLTSHFPNPLRITDRISHSFSRTSAGGDPARRMHANHRDSNYKSVGNRILLRSSRMKKDPNNPKTASFMTASLGGPMRLKVRGHWVPRILI